MITLIVLVLSIAFAGFILAVFSIGNTVDQTSVGFIYLGNYDEDQYDTRLSREIDLWKVTADYRIEYQDYTYLVDLSMIDFDSDATISNLVKDRENKAYFNLSIDNIVTLEDEIMTQFTTSVTSTFNIELFTSDLMNDVSALKNRKIYDLTDYLEPNVSATTLDQAEVTSISSPDVLSIIAQVSSIYIGANQRFSLLNQLGDLPLTNEQLSIIASGIQAVTMNTNFNGFIFEQNYTLPTWASSGMNVRILRVNQFDFTFFNDFSFNYQILIEQVDATTLSFSLLGYPLITAYETTPVFQVSIPFQTIYIVNEDINELTENVIITETDTEYIYHVLIQTGVAGHVTFYMRTETRLGELGDSIKLFDEESLPTPEIYYENIVDKEVI